VGAAEFVEVIRLVGIVAISIEVGLESEIMVGLLLQ